MEPCSSTINWAPVPDQGRVQRVNERMDLLQDSQITGFSGESQSEASDSRFLPLKIYRVNYSLRRVNMLEYDPLLLSLGPYHHKMNERFEDMDKTKQLYFQSLCARRGSSSPIEKTCLAEMKNIEGDARAAYASSYKSLNSKEFIRMMMLDGCFIIELLRIYAYPDLHNKYTNDPILRIEFLAPQLFRDMLLFENQLPLFVLEKLFELTKGPEDETRNFVDLALNVLPSMLGEEFDKKFDKKSHHLKESPHLLGLAYIAYVLPFPTQLSTNDKCAYKEDIRSATALREAGVEFKLNEALNDHAFGIIFTDNGVLEIPRLTIEDYTESLMRNFIACEQYCKEGKLHRVTDYFIFMDCLINTSKDVELLRHERIIENGLGDDEKVSQMFNQITSSVSYDKKTFYYAKQSKKVNEYCGKRWNVWRAKLRHDYFNSPWALLSFLAALALLLLTSIQTIFSVLSYFHPK